MNENVDLKPRDSQLYSGPEESDQDTWFPDRRTLAEKMQEAIEQAGIELRREIRKAIESES
jgi:hypothetical protein